MNDIIKCDLLLDIMQTGSGMDDYKSILYYMNNIKYNIIKAINCSDSNNYNFIIDNDSNRTIEYNSKYIAHGAYSSVIAIKCINSSNFTDTLVLKILFVKNITHDEQIYWDQRYYDIYIRNKLLFNNALATCFFYGNKIDKVTSYESTEPKPEEYDNLFREKHLSFNIFKYYTQNVSEIDNKKIIILKLASLLYFIKKNKIYIDDFKFANIAFEGTNIVFIDFSEKLFTSYYKDYKIRYWSTFSFGAYNSSYLKKKFYLLLNYESEKTKFFIENDIKLNRYTYSTSLNINNSRKENVAIRKVLKKNLNPIFEFNDRYHGYYLSDFDPSFDKFNIISIIDIIFTIFFKNIKIRDLYYSEDIKSNGSIFKLNDNKYKLVRAISMMHYFSSFQNLNDIDILTRLLYNFIQPIDGIEPIYIEQLKFLLLDPITEFGLLGTDYENIPSYELIFKYLLDVGIQGLDKSDLYGIFKQMLDENIGSKQVIAKPKEAYKKELEKYVITNVGRDVLIILIEIGLLERNILRNTQRFSYINYYLVAFARLIEQLMNRPDYRSDTNLEIPPEKSTLPQNYAYLTSGEKIKKWGKGMDGIYKETDVYKRNKEIVIISNDESILSKQKELDNHSLRRFAKIIVEYLKANKKLEIPSDLSDQLMEPFKSALVKFEQLQRLNKSKYLKYKIKYLELKKLNIKS